MQIISTYSLLPLISSIFVLTLGFFIWLKRPKEWLHILFALYSFTIAVWLFGTFFLFNTTSTAAQIQWDRFIYAGVVFIPIFLYHFGLLYINTRQQRLILIIGYLLGFFFLPLSRQDSFVHDLYRYTWGAHTIAGPWHHVFLVYFFFYFILFFINLVAYYRQAQGDKKRQARFMLIGFAILDLVGPLAFLPAYGIPVYPVVFLSGIPFVLIIAYAVIKHNALNVKTIAAEVAVSMLNLIAFSELFFVKSGLELLFRASVFLAVIGVSISLIHSVHREIERREETTKLAKSLEHANRRLKDLYEQKTEFLSIASHQLRTPLSIIKGYVELIEDGAYGVPTKKMAAVLGNIDVTNERLVRLVDEFLDVTRIEQGRTKFIFAKADINKLITSVVAELRPRARDKELRISWSPAKLPLVHFDEEKIRHVIFNFIDNAIKYTDAGTIVVKAVLHGGRLVVGVQDRGVGFDPVDQNKFFQKFYRGENTRTTNVMGTGLGLFVCRKFIEAHRGGVAAQSAGIGKGSAFSFWLPVGRVK